MFAIAVRDGQLIWEPAPDPVPGAGEVLVRVVATAVNRADLEQVAGNYPPPPGESAILGLECAGVVEALGPGVTTWTVGDRVGALLAGGGYAQRVVVPQGQLFAAPDTMDLHDVAAIPEVFTTAWLNLRVEAALSGGERVLLHAGASGVGTAAVQLCRLWGNPCFVVVGTDAKIEACRSLGADGGANRTRGSWVPAVREWAPEGVDVVLDPVAGTTLADDQRVLAVGGRVVVLGLLGGRQATVDLARLLVKRQRIAGSVLRSRSRQEKASIVEAMWAELGPAFARGALAPVVHARMPVTHAGAAHKELATDTTVGKIVLTVGDAP